MALDTADKRASSIGWGLAALLVLPSPNTLDQPDRQHVAYSYRGIAASAPAAVVVHTIQLDGTYLPTVSLDGTYLPALSLDGTYLPTLALDGAAED